MTLADAAGPAAPLIPEGLDATLVLLRHGESEWIREGRFQGQAETPLSATGRRRRRWRPIALAAPARLADAAGPRRPAARDRPLPARPHDRDRRAAVAARESATARRRRARSPGSSRSAQGDWEGETHDEIARRWSPRARRVAAAAARGVGTRRRVARRRAGARPAGPRRRSSSGSAATIPAAASTGRRSAATAARGPRRGSRGRSSSATTACSRSRC